MIALILAGFLAGIGECQRGRSAVIWACVLPPMHPLYSRAQAPEIVQNSYMDGGQDLGRFRVPSVPGTSLRSSKLLNLWRTP